MKKTVTDAALTRTIGKLTRSSTQKPLTTLARACLGFLLTLVLANLAFGEGVDDYIKSQMEEQHIPGLGLAVVRRGKVIKSAGYGWADVDNKIPASAHTVFQLQSITKTFTATAVMMLVEQKKISVTDKINAYLEGVPDTWKEITIYHLLTHTSGIKDFINEPTVDLTKDIQPHDVIRSLEKLPLNFEPGEKYAYSNTGYHLLGMIITKITGMAWQDFLRQKIFQPLKMSETDINSASCALTNRALGYGWKNGQFDNGRFIAPTILGYAGGGALSTVLDLAKWDNALDAHQLVSQSTLRQMWTAGKLRDGVKTGYGLGWGVENYMGLRVVEHSGANITGFKTTFFKFIDEGITVIILSNQRQANPGNVAVGVARFYLPELQLARMKPRRDPSHSRGERLKQCLADLAENKRTSLATPEFRTVFGQTKEWGTTLTRRLKELKSFEYLGERNVQSKSVECFGVPVARLCFYRMTSGEETRYYTFFLTEDNRVATITASAE